MRLAQIIEEQADDIAEEWAAWAQREVESDARLPREEVLDHFPALLEELAASLARARDDEEPCSTEAQRHATHRLGNHFLLREVVHEFRLLRRVVFRRVRLVPTEAGILEDLARMNEALDVATAASIDRFSTQREHDLRTAAEQASSLRERFIAIVSHDLRNPLNAISLGAALMLRTADLPPALGKVAGRMVVNAERMKRMISDLLDLTRGRLGGGIPIAPRPANLASVAQGVVETMNATHRDRQIVSRASGDLDGQWDSDRLGQVIGNLLGNALEHGDPASPVELALEDAGEKVLLVVHNAGSPIRAADLPYVFDAFRRGETPASNGLGLGLFIAREIVRAHGGEVDVTSTQAEGTTFTVSLPRGAAQPPAEI